MPILLGGFSTQDQQTGKRRNSYFGMSTEAKKPKDSRQYSTQKATDVKPQRTRMEHLDGHSRNTAKVTNSSNAPTPRAIGAKAASPTISLPSPARARLDLRGDVDADEDGESTPVAGQDAAGQATMNSGTVSQLETCRVRRSWMAQGAARTPAR